MHSIKAVATTTQICDYLTQIASGAGDSISITKTDAQGVTSTTGDSSTNLALTCLLSPNASAHEHEMTPEQMRALSNADLLFVNGVDLEHFLDKSVTASGFKGTLMVTSGVPNAQQPSGSFTVDAGSTKIDVQPWPFAGENGEEAEFSHDPHVWTDPAQARMQVANIAEALAKAAPESKDAWEQAASAYEDKLTALDTWAKQSLNTVPAEHRVLFTSHDAFGYFSKAYGIKFIGAALSDFNHQQDATTEHIDQAVRQVKESGARALFAENSNNSKSIQAIARAAGVKAITDEDALYGDSLGPAGSPGETYIGSIIHNVATVVEAWGGTVAPLPDELA